MRLTSLNDITRKYRHIFLAPHFDDVVYSCGGTLSVQVSTGLRPLVITIFGGKPSANQATSPLAKQVINEMGYDDAVRLTEDRRKEDSAALDLLQADYLWLDYQECIYRGSYTSKEQFMGGEVHSNDEFIERELTQLLHRLQEDLPDVVWYAPLGVGRHVDHQIACSAADHLSRSGGKVYFYEDFPYVYRDPAALDKRIAELGGDYEYALVEVSEMLPLKLEAGDLYQSQIASNFNSREAMHKAIESYARNIRPVETVKLERYWKAR